MANLNAQEVEFFNFLTKYDLQQYFERLREDGVKKISHLQHVKSEDLEKIGLSKPERQRLLGKYEQHFSKLGKLKDVLTGKSKKYAASPNAMQAVERANVDNAMIIDERDIRLLDQIGEGAHGVVYEGKWESSNGQQIVAVKELSDNDDMMFLTEFLKEAAVMLRLRHANIIRMFGVTLSPPRLIEEFAPMGDLLSYLKVKGTSLPVSQTHSFAEQIANAMQYLEERRLVHRDLAARNVLVCTNDTLKLSDFGMARLLDEFSEVYKLSNLAMRVPIAWSALEVLTEAKFSSASDVWSYAITLWEIYSAGAAPWKGLNPIEIRDQLLAGERLSKPKRCHRQIYELMLKCWFKTVKDRPKFQAIYTSLQNMRYEQVMTIKECPADDEDELLSYRVHEVITVIDKNSEEWWTGILNEDGKFGHFQVGHISHDLTPLETLKSHLKSKKKTASSIVIGKPTNLVHKSHVGSDGTRWSSELTSADLVKPDYNRERSQSVSSGSYRVPQPTFPTGNLIELDDEMHDIARPSSGHYDSPRSYSTKAKSQSLSRIAHPVPKPRQKLPKAATIDALEDDSRDDFKHLSYSSQYSTINQDFVNPTTLVGTTNPEKYITSSSHGNYYQNIGFNTANELYCINTDGTGRHESAAGELVIQAGGRADAYARTSFVPYPEKNGAAAMTFNHQYGHSRFLPPANAEIKYPPSLQPCPLPPEQEEHQYDSLRYISQNEINRQPLPSQHAESSHNTKPTSPLMSSSNPREAPGKFAHLIDDVKGQLPQATEELCVQYLTKNKGNIELTLQDLKVHILMDMGLEKADVDSCRKALSHCQWKLDRAAEWLIEQSFS